MATRYIGDCVVRIEFDEERTNRATDGRWYYKGTIRVGEHTHAFSELATGVGGISTIASGTRERVACDSSRAYDVMAESALSFMAYYTTHNRGDDVPDWAPPAEVADAIEEGMMAGLVDDPRGNCNAYEVRRSPKGPARVVRA